MKLSILIPQYKETEDILRPMFDSIKNQQGIDLNEVEVVVVNDGSDVIIPDEFFDSYPFETRYYLHEHAGVSATRNCCFEMAQGDYVMFCDADDMFFTVAGLYIIFDTIDKGEFDTFVSTFSEESYRDGKFTYINHPNDATFVHGKVYRRQFLIDNNIAWNPNLTIHEDSYFNYLCRVCAEESRSRYCKDVFYLWKYRPDSVCRSDKKYLLKTYTNMLDSSYALVNQLVCRGKLESAEFIAFNMLMNCYYDLNKPEWLAPENKEYRDKTIEKIKEYHKKYSSLADMLSEESKRTALKNLKDKKMSEGLYFEQYTYSEWVKFLNS